MALQNTKHWPKRTATADRLSTFRQYEEGPITANGFLLTSSVGRENVCCEPYPCYLDNVPEAEQCIALTCCEHELQLWAIFKDPSMPDGYAASFEIVGSNDKFVTETVITTITFTGAGQKMHTQPFTNVVGDQAFQAIKVRGTGVAGYSMDVWVGQGRHV